jgi:hypothetical protein
MGMFSHIDGHSIAFSGDNIFPPPNDNPIPSLIYRNHVHKTSHLQTARLYLEYKPEILCTGHDLKREVKPQVYENFAHNAAEMTRHFELLLPGEADFGLEPSWVQIYPYQSLAQPGDALNLQVRVNNYLDHATSAEVRLVLPDDWSVTPAQAALELPARQPGVRPAAASFRVQIPAQYTFAYPRVAIAVDVTFDGRRLGQVAEATIEQAR